MPVSIFQLHPPFQAAGAYVIGTGRATGRQAALGFGAQEYIDLENEKLQDVGGVDLVFDIFGGDIAIQSASLIRAGGTLVTIAGPTEARPVNGSAIDFVVEAIPAQLSEVVQRLRDGRLKTNIGTISTLDDAGYLQFNKTGKRKNNYPRSPLRLIPYFYAEWEEIDGVCILSKG